MMNSDRLLTPEQATRRLLVLTVTRWAPVGLVVGLFGLLALERGLSVAQVLLYAAAQGIVVVLLELPTSGFADAFGRRPLLLAAGVVNIGTALLYLRADSFLDFALAAAAMGVYRALDSGPLEAWFVDTVHASDPDRDLSPDLARAGVALGLSIAAGAVVSRALVAWHPVAAYSPLAFPVALYAAGGTVHLALTAALMRKPARDERESFAGAVHRAGASARGTPAVIASALGLLRTDPVLRGLLVVEVGWMFAMTVFESFQPLRLAELIGSEQEAGRWVGPVNAGGWLVFAAGSALAW